MSAILDSSAAVDALAKALRGVVEAGEGALVAEGRLVPERRLMEIYGVGRRTVRLALDRLAEEGLVFRRQGQGTFIKPVPPPPMRAGGLSLLTSPVEIMEVRREIEPALAKLAALRATPADIEAMRRLAEKGAQAQTGAQYEQWDSAFLEKIAESVRNSLFLGLFGMIGAVRVEQKWTLMREKSFTPAIRDDLVAQHLAIVAAIAERDPRGAEAAMRAHLSRVGTLVGTSD